MSLWILDSYGYRWSIAAKDREEAEKLAVIYNAEVVRKVGK